MAELVVALDVQTKQEALALADQLKGSVPWLKVGMELFTAEGPSVIAELADRDFKVFLDMKFFDIPNTVAGAVRSAARMGAAMTNIHLIGGRRMAEAALEGRDAATVGGDKGPILLGVTVLTSMDAADMADLGGGQPGDKVLALAQKGSNYGLDGVVCSAMEVVEIKKACGADFACLTPGIRPADHAGGDDQRRVMTPGDAVRAGSDYLVVGRPVTQADSPAEAAQAILQQMST